MADSFWYPFVEDVLTIHDDIVSEYPDTEFGIRNRGDIELALHYIEEGHFGTAPETIHERAFHLLRLRVANRPFGTRMSVPRSTWRSCSTSEEITLAGEIEEWRDDLIRFGVDELTGSSSDPND
jgi:death-on-curing protein